MITMLRSLAALALLAACVGADALGKPSYQQVGCRGVYEESSFATLDRVCEACHSLFPNVDKCRKDCFTTEWFKGCATALQYDSNEIEQFKTAIRHLHGASLGF